MRPSSPQVPEHPECIESVPTPVPEALAWEVLAFWNRQMGTLNNTRTAQRLRTLVCVAREPGGALIATSTARIAPMPLRGGRPYFFYRHYLHPAHRRLQLATRLLLGAHGVLATRRGPAGLPAGITLIMHPAEFGSMDVERYYDIELGYKLVRRTEQGMLVISRDFPNP
jgi:hypothetical protein